MSRILALVALLFALVACGSTAPSARLPEASPATTTASAPAVPVAEPASVSIPRIAAESSLIETGLNSDGSPEVPPVTQPEQASWYGLGPAPGEIGPAVILGHVNGGGRPGVFARLKEVAVGDRIVVGYKDGTSREFTVTRTEQVPKTGFPFEKVYGNTEGPELRVITCGGLFNQAADSYLDNVIVYAR
jgi:hypothetical protein